MCKTRSVQPFFGVTGWSSFTRMLPVALLACVLAGPAFGQTPEPVPSKPACGGPGVCKKGWYGKCATCYARPYNSSNCLYGYQDYVYGRGPLINLGGASLEPGFRGYGVFHSPGYGLGLRPSSMIDAQANAKGVKLAPGP